MIFLNTCIKSDSPYHKMLMLEVVPGPPTIAVSIGRLLSGVSFRYSESVAFLGFQHGDIWVRNLTLIWSIRKEVQKAQEMPCSRISALLGVSPGHMSLSALLLPSWLQGPKEMFAREEGGSSELPDSRFQHTGVLNLNIVFQSSWLNLSPIWRRLGQQTCPHFLLDIKC